MTYQFIKYPNRKIYSKQLRSYINLIELINYGAEFTIVDSKTKLDITIPTMVSAYYEAYHRNLIGLEDLISNLELLASPFKELTHVA